MVGYPTLRTRLRRMKEEEVQAAQESPPPPTFTIPAFRARKHRGGESEFLKYAYPAGFCSSSEKRPYLSSLFNPAEKRPLPTTSIVSAGAPDGDPKKISLPPDRPRVQDLLHESKEVGVPPSGAAASKRALNVTRVVVGANDVINNVGNELVQFGPGFSVGPVERSSPEAVINKLHRPWPGTPQSPISPSRMTFDGSSLKGWSSVLVGASAVDRGSGWTPWKPCSRLNWNSPQDEGKQEGCKRIRPTTVDTDQSPRESEPRHIYAKPLTGSSPRTISTGQQSKTSSRKRGNTGGGVAVAELDVPVVNDEDPPFGRQSCVDLEPAVAVLTEPRPDDLEGRTPSPYQDGGDVNHGDIEPSPPETPELVSEGCSLEVREIPKPDTNSGQQEEGLGQGKKLRGEIDLLMKDVNSSGKQEEALTVDTKDNPSVWSEGYASFVASIATNDNCTDYNPSVADDFVEQVSVKRSFSTLDTERRRGSLSKDATDIIRSHLESRNRPPTCASPCFSESRTPTSAGTRTLTSPAPPPTPPRQHVDNLLGVDPRHCTPMYLPPVDRSPETCYVRTRGDIILAVVMKTKLLKCGNDADLRTLKNTAHPVRIKAGMTMTEGIHAIVASGILTNNNDGNDESGLALGGRQICPRGAEAEHDARGACQQTQAVEYFDSQAGVWYAIRSESDWKIFLASQPGPQGAGAVFKVGGTYCRGADFLVAVTDAPPNGDAPSGRGRPQDSPRSLSPQKSKKWLARTTKKNRTGWICASFTTPGALRSPRAPCTGRDGCNSPHSSYFGNDIREYWTETRGSDARHECRIPARQSPVAVAVSFPEETSATNDRKEIVEKENSIAQLEENRRRFGPGPGGALWIPKSKTTPGAFGREKTVHHPHRPKKAKVRRLVHYLEAGLRLKGQPGAGGMPVAHTKIDTPYTKELAKWSYDEILGIPRTKALGRPPSIEH